MWVLTPPTECVLFKKNYWILVKLGNRSIQLWNEILSETLRQKIMTRCIIFVSPIRLPSCPQLRSLIQEQEGLSELVMMSSIIFRLCSWVDRLWLITDSNKWMTRRSRDSSSTLSRWFSSPLLQIHARIEVTNKIPSFYSRIRVQLINIISKEREYDLPN